jgi:hypothetical protein
MEKILNPTYRPYINRIFKVNNPLPIIFGIAGILIVGIFYGIHGITISIGICLVFIALLIITNAVDNIYFLKSFILNPTTKTISLSIVRFNTPYLNTQFDIKDLNLEICEKVVVFESYSLKISDTKSCKMIINQKCVVGWNTKLFVEIVHEVDKITGKKTDVSTVKGAFRYGT